MASRLLFFLSLFIFATCRAQQRFQLAPPLIKYNTVFFTSSTKVVLEFAQQGATIHFTTTGKEPTAQDKLFQNPIRISNRLTTVKAKTFGAGFLPSETVQATFIKDGFPIRSVTTPVPDERHNGNGTQTLMDNEGGIADLHNTNWLGFQQDSLELRVVLAKRKAVRSVLLNFLRDHGSWIFLPHHIYIYYFDRKYGDFKKFASGSFPATEMTAGSACNYQLLASHKKRNTDTLKIIIKKITAVPDGHPGNVPQSWLFIDEIKVY